MRFWILIYAICAAPAVQGLPTGEFLIDTTRLSTPGGDASVGFDGTNFLAVWRDFRSGSNDLFAARVDQSGRVLDPNGILVAEEIGYSAPAVAFGSVNYLVVYERNDHIRAKRVSPDGSVIEPEIVVSNEGESQNDPKVAYDGANYLVVWKDYRVDNDDIYCARVSPAGVVLDTASIPVADSLFWEERPDVCATDSGFWVVWETGYNPTNIHAARVTSNGQVLDHNGFPVAPNPAQQAYPATASDGANALIAWRDDRAGEGDIYGARVTWAGQVLDTAGFLISGATDFQGPVDIGFDGTNYFLAWEDYRNNPQAGDIYAARVTPDAQVLDPNGIPVEVDTLYEEIPAITCGDSASLVLWTGQILPSLEPGIQSKRVSASGVVLDTTATTVSTYCPAQWDPAVAYDGTNYLVVWEDDRNEPGYGTDIYAARVSPTGEVLDPACIPVCIEEGWQMYPAVTFNGVNYVVAWQDERYGQPDIYVARVTPAGQLVDTQAIAVAWNSRDDECYPTVVAGDTVTLVAWERERIDIEGRRIGRSGQVLDPDVIEISPDERGRCPAAAFDGTDFLVVFHDDRNDTVDIFGTKIGQDGTVLNAEFRISVGDTARECEARVAFDGTNHLVVWQTERPGNWEIHATRLTPACVVLDSPSVVVAQTGRNEADADEDVVFDGTDFVVVWEDNGRNPETTDICGARVSTGGQVLERFAVVRQPGSQYVPRLAHGAGNQLLLVYEGWTSVYQGQLFNTDHIWGKLSPLTGFSEGRPSTAQGSPLPATIVRGVLFLSEASGGERGATNVLLDISGRKVLDLLPGPNDVSRLAPGVYFVVPGSVRGTGTIGPTRKVVITK